MKTKLAFATGVFATVVLLAPMTQAANGGGSVKIGYTFTDEEGSREVNQETFNLYEGVGLSLTNWNYSFDNGIQLQADLRNITLNNRLLEAEVTKPGKFNLTLNNSQYRRFYDFDGNRFTRRAMTNVRLSVSPVSHIEVFGGFNRHDKHGTRELAPLTSYGRELIDTALRAEDWTQNRYSGGLKWENRKVMARAEYRFIDYNDNTIHDLDRTANQLNATVSLPFPWWQQLSLTGGYMFREDKLDSDTAKLRIQQGWGAAKLRLSREWYLDYRIIYGITERTSVEDRTTDNIFNTVSIGKNFGRKFGARAAYESRIKDDFIDKTTSNGIVLNAWVRPTERFYATGLFSTRKEETDDTRRLLGDQDVTRHQLTAQYTDTAWGSVRVRWQMRIRSNDPLYTESLVPTAIPVFSMSALESDAVDTRIKFNAIGPEVTIRRAGLGSVNMSYTYLVGNFENTQDSVDYDFQDHVISGSITPRSFGPFTADFGATYYRAKRDQDIEKFNLNFGLLFDFFKTHHIEARYNVFNFDDYRDEGTYDAYYTGNIVEINLIKDLSF